MNTAWTLMLIAAIILLVLIFQLLGGFNLILIIAFVIFSLGAGIVRYLETR